MFCVTGTLGQFGQREPDLEMKLSRCLCLRQLVLEPFAGLSMCGRQGAGPGWTLLPGKQRPGLARERRAGAGLCAPPLPGNYRMAQDTNVLPGEEWNWEHTSCYQLHKWVTKREKKNLIKPGTSYTINLSQVWDLSKCFQHLKRESLCSTLGFLPMMFKDIISCL